MALPLNSFLNELIAILQQDYPQQLRQIVQEGRGITCLQTLDTETAILQIEDKISVMDKAPRAVNIRVNCSRPCLLKLIDGKVTLEEAFATKEFEVFGDPATLLKCYKIWENILSLSRTSPRFYFLFTKLR